MYKIKLGTSLDYFKYEKEFKPILNEKFDDALAKCKKLGFDTIDFGINMAATYTAATSALPLLPAGMQSVYDHGLKINAVHLPFGRDTDFSDPNELKRKAAVEYAKALFKVCDPFKPRCYVFHSSCELTSQTELRDERKAALVQSLKEIAGVTKTLLCMENLPRFCLANTADETLEIVKQVGGINVCVDVNHFLKESPESAIEKIGSLIKTLHISDCDQIDEMHRLPGQAKLNFMNIIGALEKIGYDGVFNYEISMDKNNFVLCTYEQIKENYDMLFNKYNSLKKK